MKDTKHNHKADKLDEVFGVNPRTLLHKMMEGNVSALTEGEQLFLLGRHLNEASGRELIAELHTLDEATRNRLQSAIEKTSSVSEVAVCYQELAPTLFNYGVRAGYVDTLVAAQRLQNESENASEKEG